MTVPSSLVVICPIHYRELLLFLVRGFGVSERMPGSVYQVIAGCAIVCESRWELRKG